MGGAWRMLAPHLEMCPACTACPEVEIAGDEVRIGEAGHLAVLKKDEWNLLVDLIQSAPAGPPPDSPFSCFRR